MKGSGTPSRVHDDRWGDAAPSMPRPMFAQTTPEGLIAATTRIRGSSAAINRAASAPFEVPTKATLWQPSSTSRSVALVKTSSGTSQIPGGCLSPPNQRRAMHVAPSPANNLARATSTLPLHPPRPTTPRPVCSAGFKMKPWRLPARSASWTPLMAQRSRRKTAGRPGRHVGNAEGAGPRRSRARRRRVDSAARIFEGIRLARDERGDANARRGECGTYLGLAKQRRHQRDALAVGFVATDLAFARMHGHEESPAWHQHAMDLDDGTSELVARAVDEAVERRHARELAIG